MVSVIYVCADTMRKEKTLHGRTEQGKKPTFMHEKIKKKTKQNKTN